MRAIRISGDVDCGVFRGFAYHFQSDELAEADRARLQEHLDGCERCAGYLDVEGSFLRALRARLRPVPTPEGLEGRIREALAAEPVVHTRIASRLGRPAAAALAASLLLAALLLQTLGAGGSAAVAIQHYPVVRAVTVVDEDCDRAGRSVREQRGCSDSRHLNVLKVADGMYWRVNLDRPLAKEIVLDPRQRGRRMLIEAEYFPALDTVRLVDVRQAEPARL